MQCNFKINQINQIKTVQTFYWQHFQRIKTFINHFNANIHHTSKTLNAKKKLCPKQRVYSISVRRDNSKCSFNLCHTRLHVLYDLWTYKNTHSQCKWPYVTILVQKQTFLFWTHVQSLFHFSINTTQKLWFFFVLFKILSSTRFF